MQDVIFIAILAAFFGLTLLFVKACERIIGPDIEAARADADAGATSAGTDEAVAA